MGAHTTDTTPAGIRARPLRNRLKRVVKYFNDNPPAGVRPGVHGGGQSGKKGKSFVSPRGYVGRRLFEFAEALYREAADAGQSPLGMFRWAHQESATGWVRGFLDGGSRTRYQLDILEKFLPVIEAEIAGDKANRQAHVESMTLGPARVEVTSSPVPVEVVTGTEIVESGKVVAMPQKTWTEEPPSVSDEGQWKPGTFDAEAVAMAEVVEALSRLDDKARRRVLYYAADRLEIAL